MTEIQFGDSVKDLFQGFLKKHSLENCISIKFGNNGGSAALNVVAESREVADFWIRGLQKLIINRGNILPQNNFYQLVPDIQLLKTKGASEKPREAWGQVALRMLCTRPSPLLFLDFHYYRPFTIRSHLLTKHLGQAKFII